MGYQRRLSHPLLPPLPSIIWSSTSGNGHLERHNPLRITVVYRTECTWFWSESGVVCLKLINARWMLVGWCVGWWDGACVKMCVASSLCACKDLQPSAMGFLWGVCVSWAPKILLQWMVHPAWKIPTQYPANTKQLFLVLLSWDSELSFCLWRYGAAGGKRDGSGRRYLHAKAENPKWPRAIYMDPPISTTYGAESSEHRWTSLSDADQ